VKERGGEGTKEHHMKEPTTLLKNTFNAINK
jgi:hypothetical protein